MAAKYLCPTCNFFQAVLDIDLGKKVKCPRCGAIGQVVGNVSPSGSATNPPFQVKIIHEGKAVGPPALPDDRQQNSIRVGHPSASPPPRPKGGWYYCRANEQVGPVSESDLQALIRHGAVRSWDKIWTQGMKESVPTSECFEFDEEEPRPRRRRRKSGSDAGRVCGILACVLGLQRSATRMILSALICRS
jgi:uncharacterized protein DUF4339